MEKILQELSMFKFQNLTLNPSQIDNIDQIAFENSKELISADHIKIQNMWELISEAQAFWENVYLMLNQSKQQETKLQVLILIHNKVRKNWVNENLEIREDVKKLLGMICQSYKGSQLNSLEMAFHRKVNHIIAEILKYEWAGEWKNFLQNICSAVSENPVTAETYFDLLKIIFQQIFSSNNRLITSEDSQTLHQIISLYSINMNQIFQFYLDREKNESKILLTNALEALGEILPWLPAYYIFHGFIIEKVITLIDYFSVPAFNCFRVVFQLKENHKQISSTKIKLKKISFITEIMEKIKNMENDLQFIHTQLISLICTFYRSEKSEIKSEALHILNNKIISWITTLPNYDYEQNFDQNLQLIQIINEVINEIQFDIISQILKFIIVLAPCPQRFVEFYEKEKIFQNQRITDKEIERCYEKLIFKVCQKFNSFIFKTKIIPLVPTNMRDLQSLCRLGWYFYYVSKIDTSFGMNSSFIQLCLTISDSIRSNMKEKKRKNSRFPSTSFCHQMIICLRSIIMISLCTQELDESQKRRDLLTHLIKINFLQEKNLINFSFQIFHQAINYLEEEHLQQLMCCIHEGIHENANEHKLIVSFSKGLRNIVCQNNEKILCEFVVQMIDSERKRYIKLVQNQKVCIEQFRSENSDKNRLIYSSNKSQFNKIKENSLFLMKIFTILIPIMKQNALCIFESQLSFLSLLTPFYSSLQNQQYLQKYIQLHIAIIENVQQNETIAKSINEFLLLYKEHVVYRDILLQYFSAFIVCQWKKTHWLQSTLLRIFDNDFNRQIPTIAGFLQNIVKSEGFLYLSSQLISRILFYLFNFCQKQGNLPLGSFEILIHLLSSIYQQRETQNFLKAWEYFAQIFKETFKLVYKNISEFRHHDQFCEVLCLGVKIIQKVNIPFWEGQTVQNTEQIRQRLMEFVENKKIKEKISHQISRILSEGDWERMETMVYDLLIILERGY